jgi:hypothetical protein
MNMSDDEADPANETRYGTGSPSVGRRPSPNSTAIYPFGKLLEGFDPPPVANPNPWRPPPPIFVPGQHTWVLHPQFQQPQWQFAQQNPNLNAPQFQPTPVGRPAGFGPQPPHHPAQPTAPNTLAHKHPLLNKERLIWTAWSKRETQILCDGLNAGKRAEDLIPLLPNRSLFSIRTKIGRIKKAAKKTAGEKLRYTTSDTRGGFRRPWSTEEDATLLRLRQGGMSPAQISTHLFGRTVKAVYERIKHFSLVTNPRTTREGLPPLPSVVLRPEERRKRVHWTAEEDGVLRALHAQGESYEAISAHLPGRTVRATAERIKALGLAPRRNWKHPKAKLYKTDGNRGRADMPDLSSLPPLPEGVELPATLAAEEEEEQDAEWDGYEDFEDYDHFEGEY